MLRINDVGSRPMMLHFAQTEFSRAFRVFRGKKHPPFTIASFPQPFGLANLLNLCYNLYTLYNKLKKENVYERKST